VRTFCGQGGSSYGRPHLLEQKHRVFRNLWCVRTDKKGWASTDILRQGGDNFSRFYMGVFYGRPGPYVTFPFELLPIAFTKHLYQN